MSFSYCCSVSCIILSIWAVAQLFIMGMLFNMEVVAFIEEAEASVYDSYEDFIKKTKQNYQSIATNCWIAAAVYFVFSLISYYCLWRSKKAERLAAKQSKDIDVLCSQNTTFPKGNEETGHLMENDHSRGTLLAHRQNCKPREEPHVRVEETRPRSTRRPPPRHSRYRDIAIL